MNQVLQLLIFIVLVININPKKILFSLCTHKLLINRSTRALILRNSIIERGRKILSQKFT